MDSSASTLAPVQVTSEQILSDAFQSRDRPLERPKQSIQDLEELRSFQQKKRKEYEQQLNKNRLNFGQFLRYAKWEVNHNHDFPRARSILERALDVNVQHVPFWVQYIQLELSHKNVNHALNLLDRATTTLPRVNKLWFLYVQTLETLKNYQLVRNVFERWLKWHPDSSAWEAYVNFERRYDEYDNVRTIFSRYVQEYPSAQVWLKWIEFEMFAGSLSQNTETSVQNIRVVYEQAVDTIISDKRIRDDPELPAIIANWADWEISVKEYERARAIFVTLLNENSKIKLSKQQRSQISSSFTTFEKRHGNKDSIESSVLQKRKLRHQENIEKNPQDIDSWWSYIQIVQSENNIEETRNAFKGATFNVPSSKTKSIQWRRHIMLWIKYALWEEFDNEDITLARAVWNECLKVIPHKNFTFAKAWIHFAEFELRNNESEESLQTARKILGRGIGQSSVSGPKRKLFAYYISLEKRLGEWDRVRMLYERWLEVATSTGTSSIPVVLEYVEFEKSLNEIDRSISIFQIALELSEDAKISSSFEPVETIWISFINFYKEELKYDDARSLYRLLLEKMDSTKVWISLALFESSIPSSRQLIEYEESNADEFEFSVEDEHRENTRTVFKEAELHFKNIDSKNERLVILESWKSYEKLHGNNESLADITKKLPTIVKRRRTVDGVDEEYLDYIFPEDESSAAKVPGISKFLANAKKWAALSSQKM
ncbi:hypothetical protein G9P44_001427 [Scheffersomyces stipitis]|nr:hypothetical protein G9P44_001427 [Scheffersomyces stipitis]